MNHVSKRGLAADLEVAAHEWSQTLAHFKQARPLLDREKFTIGRCIQANGLAPVIQALIGARHEPGNEKFNPADHLSLDRVLGHKNFLRFVGLGAKQQAKAAVTRLQPTPAPEREPEPQADPEKVRAILRGAFSKMDPMHRMKCPHDQADEISRSEQTVGTRRFLSVHLVCKTCGAKFARNTPMENP